MNALAICVDGVEDDELIDAALAWTARFDRIDVWCAYGDAAARELAYVRGRHGRPPPERHAPPPGPPPPPHHDSVDQEQAQAIVQRASALLRAHQIDAHERILGGSDSGHALAQASTPDVALFLAAGHGAGTGPRSVGHVARFVIDHAVGPVIVVRLRSGAERW